MDNLAINERYDYIAAPRDGQWGLHVAGTGMRIAPPRTPYQVYERSAPFQWSRGRTLPYYGMVYVTDGQGEFTLPDCGRLRVQAGDLLLLFPNVWHNYWPDPDSGWTEFWVLFSGLLPDRWAQHHWFRPAQPKLHPGVHPDLLGLFDQLLTTARANPPLANQILAGLTMQTLASVFSHWQHGATPRDEGADSLIRQAQQIIEEQWNQPVDMRRLAASLRMSYRHFRRLFQQCTGVPPGQYLLNLRINRAKRLLEEPLTIAEVAYRAGFSDPYYFSRLFKQKTGVSPKKWRG